MKLNGPKLLVGIVCRLIRPSVNVYTEFPEQQGKVNVLYCYATGFYPGDIEVTFYLNGQKSTVKAETSDLMYGEDWTFRVYKYMNITPQYGDKYTCEVRHSSMVEPKMTEWKSSLYKVWLKIA
uniref:Beta-2-microglobulin n=1 Tax=Sinocyclocheilus anshuiensis TaxID=1608454 RepID=A0A671K7W0_9TELE